MQPVVLVGEGARHRASPGDEIEPLARDADRRLLPADPTTADPDQTVE